MAQLEPKNMDKIEKANQEAAKREKMIANQWRTFSKTAAFKDWMQYCEQNKEMLLEYAQEMVMPSPVKNGEQIILTIEKAHSLLQNRRGIDIVKTYVDGYVNLAA